MIVLSLMAGVSDAQKIIQYTSGMGARSSTNGNVWVLFGGVRASHEGMTLTSDSAHFDVEENSFEAFVNVAIKLTDTTYIYGERLYYDGNTRVLDIWDDTVIMIDGRTTLLANHLTYERDASTAYYTEWGYARSENRLLYSEQGEYRAGQKQFYIYNDVYLTDSSSTLTTDTLLYNTETKIAHFSSPTNIVSDKSRIYSELGDYQTDTRYAVSYKASHVDNEGRSIDCDTLYYRDDQQYGRAFGHVVIVDSVNDITCTGGYGETRQDSNCSFVTDSALVVFVDEGDSLYLHADTVSLFLDSANNLRAVRANYHVKMYRKDAQAMCDSAHYWAEGSLMTMFGSPALWYEHYQCTADTISVQHDTTGVKRAVLNDNCFAIEQVDADKFNQVKGRKGVVYFKRGEPDYADVLGNAQMVYYITETDTTDRSYLLGTNVGVGTDMRIYFDSTRAPSRVVTFENPDMQTYPVNAVPESQKRLQGFRWLSFKRPRKPEDVFVW